MITRAIGKHLPFRLLQRLARQIRVQLGPREAIVPLAGPAALVWIYWKPSWKTGIIAHALRTRPGAFVDIGANVGQTLADFLATGADTPYWGFEPNVRCLSFLSDLIDASGFHDVELVPVGLWNQIGLRRLYMTSDSPTDQTASLRPELRPASIRRQQWIWSAPFDDVMKSMDEPALALIKIDVEGSELEVLQGMMRTLQRDPPPILCEVLLADPAADHALYRQRTEALYALLRQLDYRIFRVRFTPDRVFHGLAEVPFFPVDSWTPERAHECDYLFAPASFPLPAMAGVEAGRKNSLSP
jgi:FkbM family methyltransferase